MSQDIWDNLKAWQRYTLLVPFTLYLISLTTTMAGMETFGWLTVIVLFAISVQYWFQHKRWIWVTLGWNWAFLGFWAVGILGAFFKLNMENGETGYIIGEFRWIIIYYMLTTMISLIYDKPIFKKFLVMILAFVSLVSVYSIVQFYTGIDIARSEPYAVGVAGKYWRAKGFFQNTMTYSYAFGMFFFFFASLIFYKLKGLKAYNPLNSEKATMVKKLLYVLCLTVMATALLLTFTRGLWLAFTITLLTATFVESKKLFAKTVSALVVLMAVLYFSFPIFSERFTSIADTGHTSNLSRFGLWEANIELFKENPIFGVGHRQNWRHMERLYAELNIENGFIGHAHNNFFQFLSTTGLIGVTLWIIIQFLFLKLGWQAYKNPEIKPIGMGVLAAWLCFHLGGGTEATFIDGESLHIYLFIMSMLIIFKQKFTNQNSEKAV